jgi:hypothetical protein
MTVMEHAHRTNAYWKGSGWVLGGYVLLQLAYRIPRETWPDIVRDHAIPPFWLLLSVVYLWVGGRLRRLDAGWVRAVWHVLHILLFVCVAGMLGYRRYIGDIPYGMTSTAKTITEFLISPVLYITLGLLYRAPGG